MEYCNFCHQIIRAADTEVSIMELPFHIDCANRAIAIENEAKFIREADIKRKKNVRRNVMEVRNE